MNEIHMKNSTLCKDIYGTFSSSKYIYIFKRQ